MIFYYYVPAVLFFVGIVFLVQVGSALFFLLGLHFISISIIIMLHFFASDPENVVYLGLLLYGFIALIQSSFSLNHLKKALLHESSSK